MLYKITSMLDAVADSLEKKGFIKEAYEIDKIADALDPKIIWDRDSLKPGDTKNTYWIFGKGLNGKYYSGTSVHHHMSGEQMGNIEDVNEITKAEYDKAVK